MRAWISPLPLPLKYLHDFHLISQSYQRLLPQFRDSLSMMLVQRLSINVVIVIVVIAPHLPIPNAHSPNPLPFPPMHPEAPSGGISYSPRVGRKKKRPTIPLPADVFIFLSFHHNIVFAPLPSLGKKNENKDENSAITSKGTKQRCFYLLG